MDWVPRNVDHDECRRIVKRSNIVCAVAIRGWLDPSANRLARLVFAVRADDAWSESRKAHERSHGRSMECKPC